MGLWGERGDSLAPFQLPFPGIAPFGHKSSSSQIRYYGFSLFPSILGTAGAYLRIVPHGLLHFGHSSDFCKKSSKFLCHAWGTFRRNRPSVPNQDSLPQNPGGTILHFNAPVPKTRKSMGNNSVKLAPVPKPSCPAPGITINEIMSPCHILRNRLLPVRLRKIPPQICRIFSPSSSALNTDITG